LLPEPVDGEPPGADQEKEPSPPPAVKLAELPVCTLWLEGEHQGAPPPDVYVQLPSSCVADEL
jgi:hypothetical protein